MKKKRRSPRKHDVREHMRSGRAVREHSRGKGTRERVNTRIKPKIKRVKTAESSAKKLLSPFLRNMPEQDKDLYDKVFIGEKHPRRSAPPGLWLAISLPGGELWLRRPPKKDDQITIVHEYGHYVWYFNTDDEMKRVFRKHYAEAGKRAEERAKKATGKVFYPYKTWKDYFLAGRAGRNAQEAFAEAYAWYYAPYLTRHKESYQSLMKEKRPEMYEAIKVIEKMRTRK